MSHFILPGFGNPTPPPPPTLSNNLGTLSGMLSQLANLLDQNLDTIVDDIEDGPVEPSIVVTPSPLFTQEHGALWDALINGAPIEIVEETYPDTLRVTVYDAEWENEKVTLAADGQPINLFPSQAVITLPYPNQESGWSEVTQRIKEAMAKAYPTGNLASFRWTLRNL